MFSTYMYVFTRLCHTPHTRVHNQSAVGCTRQQRNSHGCQGGGGALEDQARRGPKLIEKNSRRAAVVPRPRKQRPTMKPAFVAMRHCGTAWLLAVALLALLQIDTLPVQLDPYGCTAVLLRLHEDTSSRSLTAVPVQPYSA
jgi:hypothetical protein